MARVRGPGTPTSKGTPWDVCWTDADGRERSKRYYSETKAYKEAGRIEDQIRRGEVAHPKPLTFMAVAEKWLKTRTKTRPATRLRYRRQLELHAFPVFGRRRIAGIGEDDIGEFVTALSAQHRPAGIARIMYPVRAVFAYAVRARLIPFNPATEVDLPNADDLGVDEFEGIALTPAQVAALALECGARHELGEIIVWFVVFTGVRAGELGRLAVGDVNRLRRHITVPGTKSRRSKGRRVDYGTTLADHLHPYLDAHPRGNDRTAPLFYGRDNHSRPEPARAFDAATFYKRVFKPVAKSLGMQQLRFHDLRHTAGSWWIEAGLPLETVADRLGHADINFTRRVYIHQLHTRTEEHTAASDTWFAAQTKHTNVVPLTRKETA
jgi:integrase